jgi:hypothetical protein
MELFSRLFGSLLVFVYHCFDRVVINGYLSGISRPEQVVYFFREVLRIPIISMSPFGKTTMRFSPFQISRRFKKPPIVSALK